MCSARIYMVPARPAWCTRFTLAEFFATSLMLGPFFVLSLLGALDVTSSDWIGTRSLRGIAQLTIQAIRFLWLSRSNVFELRASSLLLSGRLGRLFLNAARVISRSGDLASSYRGKRMACVRRFRDGSFQRMAWPLSVFRQRRTEKYGGGIYFGRKDCGMIGIRGLNWKRLVGLDNLRGEYAFSRDDSTGYTSTKKIPDQWIATTCGYCSVGCGIEVGVKKGRAVASRPHAIHPVNRGKLCPKGLSEHYTIAAENRAQYPLLRKNGKLARVGWDEALTVMVERFRAVQKTYGPQSLGVLSTGQLVTEEFYTLGKLVQLGFGTSNYDGNTTLCMASAVSGYKISFGSDGPPGAYEDMEKADVVLLVGANLADNHPILCQYLEANRNKTLIVADPRVSKTAMMADIHLPLKPRSDLALINGIAHILIREKMVDRAYVDRHTTGFAELEKFLADYAPERVAKITGLSQETIFKTAILYGQAKAAFIGWTMGVNHSTLGTATVNAICNLALLTGNIGRAGASPFSITGQCNAMGSREASFTSALPGYRKFDNAKDRSGAGRDLEYRRSSAPDQARLGVSGHHRSYCG